MADYFTASGVPGTNSAGASAVMRAEIEAIANGFTKIAPYTGNADKLVTINPAGSGQSSRTLQGTTDQVTVTIAAGTITLALPQSIHTGATPTFRSLTASDAGTSGTLGANASGPYLLDPGSQGWRVFIDGELRLTLTPTGLNSTPIGQTTRAAGAFTALSATDGATLAKAKSSSGVVSCPSATPTTILSGIAGNQLYRVHAFFLGATNYAAVAEIQKTGSGTPIILRKDVAGSCDITMSGDDIQISQGSGSTIDCSWTVEILG